MEVYGKDKKVDKILTHAVTMKKEYGETCARRLQQRLMEIKAAENLLELSRLPQLQFHALHGKRKGQWSISVVKNYKMTFIEAVDPLPVLPDGSIDLAAITAVRIIDPCVDYH